MRDDECTFREARDSLSVDEWEEVYGAVVHRMRSFLQTEQKDRAEILHAAVAGLSQVRSSPEITGSEEDYAKAAITYYLAFSEKYEWKSLSRLKGALIKKAKRLVFDSKKPRKAYEQAGGMPHYVAPDNPEEALLRKEAVELAVERAERFKQFMLDQGAADDSDAVQLVDFCSDKDTALTETKTRAISFKSKKVIEPGLLWDAAKVQRIRLHVLMRGRQFLEMESEL